MVTISRGFRIVFLSPHLAQICGHGFRPVNMLAAVRVGDEQFRRTNIPVMRPIQRLIPPSEFFTPPIALLYCNLLETSPVGNAMAPIMEIIPTSQMNKKCIDQKIYSFAIFKRLRYAKLNLIFDHPLVER